MRHPPILSVLHDDGVGLLAVSTISDRHLRGSLIQQQHSA
jgi:hypothetical protein